MFASLRRSHLAANDVGMEAGDGGLDHLVPYFEDGDDDETEVSISGSIYSPHDDSHGGGGGGGGGGGPADAEYDEEDDTKLLSVSASNNTLSIVYRDPGTMRFVKYVGAGAPSSRWDIAMEYEVDASDDADSSDEHDGDDD